MQAMQSLFWAIPAHDITVTKNKIVYWLNEVSMVYYLQISDSSITVM